MRKLSIVFMMAFMALYGSGDLPAPLIDLLQFLRVPHDGTLDSIVEATQERWIRPAGKERWQVADLDQDQKDHVIELADTLGFFEEKIPSRKNYEYAVILGATVFRMQKRIETLIRLWDEGIRFKRIVILTGQRPLDPSVEALTEICETESDAVEVLWKLAPIPEEMEDVPVVFLSEPMIKTEHGFRRPATSDTINCWMKTSPRPGACLFISNQPYCLYQDAVVRTYLPESFTVETVGDGADGSRQNAAVVLDTIARWLYQLRLQEMKKAG